MTNAPRISNWNPRTMLHMSKNRHSLKIDFAPEFTSGPTWWRRLHFTKLHHLATFSTLPLSKIWIICNPYPASVEFELAPGERLRQDVGILILRGNIWKHHDSPLNTISDMMVPDVDVFGPIMKYWISRELNAALVITVDHCRLQMQPEQTCEDLPHPNSLACSQTCCHVLGLCWTECHGSLLPAVPGNCCRPNAENSSRSALPVRWTPCPICISEAAKLRSILLSVP